MQKPGRKQLSTGPSLQCSALEMKGTVSHGPSISRRSFCWPAEARTDPSAPRRAFLFFVPFSKLPRKLCIKLLGPRPAQDQAMKAATGLQHSKRPFRSFLVSKLETQAAVAAAAAYRRRASRRRGMLRQARKASSVSAPGLRGFSLRQPARVSDLMTWERHCLFCNVWTPSGPIQSAEVLCCNIRTGTGHESCEYMLAPTSPHQLPNTTLHGCARTILARASGTRSGLRDQQRHR